MAFYALRNKVWCKGNTGKPKFNPSFRCSALFYPKNNKTISNVFYNLCSNQKNNQHTWTGTLWQSGWKP